MVWDARRTAGFTTGKPWLPVKPPQGRAQCGGAGGRAGIGAGTLPGDAGLSGGSEALRGDGRGSWTLPEPLLGFLRGEGEGALLCLFNLSHRPCAVTVAGVAGPVGPVLAAKTAAQSVRLGPNAALFLGATSDTRVSLA
jgi:alpha-glucosidase